MEQTTDQKKYEVMCFACGMPLKRQEIAVQITGQTVDFEERIAIQNTNYELCTECAEKSRAYMAGGMKKAIERREAPKTQLQTIDLSGYSLPNNPIITGS